MDEIFKKGKRTELRSRVVVKNARIYIPECIKSKKKCLYFILSVAVNTIVQKLLTICTKI